MKKILISENRQKADQTILAFQKKAERMSSAIKTYNEQPALVNLNQSTALQFLKSPKKYLDEALVNDTGIAVKNVQPQKLAELVGADYQAIMNYVQPWNVQDYIINPDLTVELSHEAQERIREENKFFLTDERQIQTYRDLQKLCDMLNTHRDRARMDRWDVNGTARSLKLETENVGDNVYNFIPDVKILPMMLSN